MDANVGVNKQLVVEPTLTNVRGYRDLIKEEDWETLKDVNIFSPVELLTPGTARSDDPIRTAINFPTPVAVKLYTLREYPVRQLLLRLMVTYSAAYTITSIG